MYIDFKLWKETMLISAEEEKKNVLEKLDKCGGKRAVIINIILDHNMQITSSDNGRIIEIPYLYRLDRKEIGTEELEKQAQVKSEDIENKLKVEKELKRQIKQQNKGTQQK